MNTTNGAAVYRMSAEHHRAQAEDWPYSAVRAVLGLVQRSHPETANMTSLVVARCDGVEFYRVSANEADLVPFRRRWSALRGLALGRGRWRISLSRGARSYRGGFVRSWCVFSSGSSSTSGLLSPSPRWIAPGAIAASPSATSIASRGAIVGRHYSYVSQRRLTKAQGKQERQEEQRS